MESEEAYGRTEVDKVLAKERDLTEMNQRLQYRVECLEGKLRQKNKAGKTGGQTFSIFHFIIRFFLEMAYFYIFVWNKIFGFNSFLESFLKIHN